MDCPICFNVITNSCVGSCCHHFCKNCLIDWCKHGGTQCPICKTTISEIKFDSEFDYINLLIQSKNNSNIYDISNNYSYIIDLKENDKAGITLKNNYINFSRGPGVKISKLDKKCKFFNSGLRKNNVIISINNIPCINHKQSIDIINRCLLSGKQIKINLL